MSSQYTRSAAAARRRDPSRRMPSWMYQLDEAVQATKSADQGMTNLLARLQAERRVGILIINPDADRSYRDHYAEEAILTHLDWLDECQAMERDLRRTITRIRKLGGNPNLPPQPHLDDREGS